MIPEFNVLVVEHHLGQSLLMRKQVVVSFKLIIPRALQFLFLLWRPRIFQVLLHNLWFVEEWLIYYLVFLLEIGLELFGHWTFIFIYISDWLSFELDFLNLLVLGWTHRHHSSTYFVFLIEVVICLHVHQLRIIDVVSRGGLWVARKGCHTVATLCILRAVGVFPEVARPTEILLKLFILDVHRLDLLCIRFILTDDVQIVVKSIPVFNYELSWVQSHYWLACLFKFNFKSEYQRLEFKETKVSDVSKCQLERTWEVAFWNLHSIDFVTHTIGIFVQPFFFKLKVISACRSRKVGHTRNEAWCKTWFCQQIHLNLFHND